MLNRYIEAVRKHKMENKRDIFSDPPKPVEPTADELQRRADLKSAEDTQREDYIFGKDRNKATADKFGLPRYSEKKK